MYKIYPLSVDLSDNSPSVTDRKRPRLLIPVVFAPHLLTPQLSLPSATSASQTIFCFNLPTAVPIDFTITLSTSAPTLLLLLVFHTQRSGVQAQGLQLPTAQVYVHLGMFHVSFGIYSYQKVSGNGGNSRRHQK